jgi:inner membrane protein
MLIKTHLAITLCFVLLFIPFVKMPLLFLVVALLATYIPDIDSKHSKIGHYFFLRPFQWFARHRGFVHSFTFLILVTLGFALFLPFLALAFFLGYCSHLIADSFTIEGIKPFYPHKKVCRGRIRTGSLSETNIFVVFILLDLFLFVAKASSIL